MNYKKIYSDNSHAGAYLFYGREKYLIENAIKYLTVKYVKDTAAFNLIKLDGKTISPADILDACETYPVMSEKKVVIVKDVVDFISENDLKKDFFDFLDNLSDFVVLIMWDRSSIKKNTKLFKYFKKIGRDIEFPKLQNADLVNFIKGYLIRKGKKIKPSDISYLINVSNYNSRNEEITLLDLKSELDKIASLNSSEIVTKADIDLSMTEGIDTNIFNFLDAMMKRDLNQAIFELDNLYKLNEPILKIFTMIIRQVRNFLSFLTLTEKGYSNPEIMKIIGIKSFEFKKIIGNVKNFEKSFLISFYEELIKADELFKTTSIDEKIIMETLIVKYCVKFSWNIDKNMVK